MNLVLFRRDECPGVLPASDARARHIVSVLRCTPGGMFACGLVNGPRGRARVERLDESGVHLSFDWEPQPPPPLAPLVLLVGLPRPQTARKVLGEATTLGAAKLIFFRSQRGEASYGDSTLWRSGEVQRLLEAAAAQAFCTRLPEVQRTDDLITAVSAFSAGPGSRLALDNYEAEAALADAPLAGVPATLAVGSERGWSSAERAVLREHKFTLAHLGPRVLRTETACTAALAVLKTRLGLW